MSCSREAAATDRPYQPERARSNHLLPLHPVHAGGAAAAPGPAAEGMGGMASMGGGMRTPSANMSDACYAEGGRASEACKAFRRTDADWQADLGLLCAAMPYMPGCALSRQCEAGEACGAYCAPSALTGAICIDMPKVRAGSRARLLACLSAAAFQPPLLIPPARSPPLPLQMGGCEAWNALCGNGSVVEQCTQPGAVPGAPTTAVVREAIAVSAEARACAAPLSTLLCTTADPNASLHAL